MPGYPGQYESKAVLSDGSRIHLCPIRPDDATRLLDLYHRLSPRSLYHRFFTVPRPHPVYAKYLMVSLAPQAKVKDQPEENAKAHRRSS